MSRFALLSADGTPVEVDAEAARTGLADGSLRTAQPLRVRHAQTGRMGTIAPDRVADALRSGVFDLDTPEDAERRQYARDQNLATEGVTGAASLLRGATLEGSQLLEEGLGIREEIDRMRGANPNAATLGDLAGIVLPALVTGGASAEARGLAEGASLAERGASSLARGVTAPGRAALSLGEHVGADVARRLAPEGASLARRVIARAAGGATEGSLQTAAMESGRVLTEEALGEDPGDVADRMIASTGLGAVLGGSLLGGGALLGEGLAATRRSGREVAELMSRRFATETGEPLEAGVAALLGHVADASAAVSGRDAGAIRSLTSDALRRGSPGYRARQVIERGDEVLETGSRQLVDALNEALPSLRAIREEATSGARVGQYARHMREGTGAIGEQSATLQAAIDQAEALARRIETEARTFQSASEFGPSSRRAQQQIDAGVARARRRLADAVGAGDGSSATLAGTVDDAARSAEIMSALDELKQHIGRAVERTRNHDAVVGLYDDLRRSLEQQDLWGSGASEMQREINAGFHAYLQHDAAFGRQFLTEAGQEGFERLMQADSSRVRAFLGRIGTAANDTQDATLRAWLDGVDQLNGAALGTAELSGAARAQSAAARDAIANVRRVLGSVETDARTLNQWRALGGGGTGGFGAGALALAGGGAAVLGPIGAAAGLLGSPIHMVRMLGAIERLAARTDGQISTAVRGFFARTSRSARIASGRATTATRQLPIGSIEAYRERIARLDASSDPSRRSADLAESTTQLGRAAPRVQAAVQTRAATADAFLRARRPRSTLAGSLLPSARGRDRQPPRAEIDRFMRYARAVDDPGSVIDDLRDGRLSREGVEALREVYPALFARLTQAVAQELARKGSEPSYQDRIQLGVLLGVPTDPSLTPESIAVLQSLSFPSPQPPPTSAAPSGKAPDIAGAFASESDRVSARRATG